MTRRGFIELSILLLIFPILCVITLGAYAQIVHQRPWWDLPAKQSITIQNVGGGTCWIKEGEQHAHIEGDMTWQRCAEMALKAFEKRPLP